MKSKGLAFQYNPSVEISDGVWYCEKQDLYWKNGTVYDKQSAYHNGIIGTGMQLKQSIKEHN